MKQKSGGKGKVGVLGINGENVRTERAKCMEMAVQVLQVGAE